MTIEQEIRFELERQDVDFVRFADISHLSAQQNKGYLRAVVFGVALTPEYVRQLGNDSSLGIGEFSVQEHRMGDVADLLAGFLTARGYGAYAQSDAHIIATGCYDEPNKATPLPHKTVAVLAGLGWIGKDNLLVTPEYGSALCMCTVLTDAPLPAEPNGTAESKCGECRICTDVCPAGVIRGKLWGPGTPRDELVDVFHCAECFKCLTDCPWTRKYVKKHAAAG